ncbi:GNAT family N-acetyltransferase [Natrialba swarupiae]|nr:GNAT family N-acetyltransferase [Natrialba swarupiae]
MTPTIEAFLSDSAGLAAGARLYRDVFNEPPGTTTGPSRRRERGSRSSSRRRVLAATLPGSRATSPGWWSGRKSGGTTARSSTSESCVSTRSPAPRVATALMDHLAGLRRAGVDSIYLLTLRDTAAHAFYEKRGFDLDDRTVLLSRRLER